MSIFSEPTVTLDKEVFVPAAKDLHVLLQEGDVACEEVSKPLIDILQLIDGVSFQPEDLQSIRSTLASSGPGVVRATIFTDPLERGDVSVECSIPVHPVVDTDGVFLSSDSGSHSDIRLSFIHRSGRNYTNVGLKFSDSGGLLSGHISLQTRSNPSLIFTGSDNEVQFDEKGKITVVGSSFQTYFHTGDTLPLPAILSLIVQSVDFEKPVAIESTIHPHEINERSVLVPDFDTNYTKLIRLLPFNLRNDQDMQAIISTVADYWRDISYGMIIPQKFVLEQLLQSTGHVSELEVHDAKNVLLESQHMWDRIVDDLTKISEDMKLTWSEVNELSSRVDILKDRLIDDTVALLLQAIMENPKYGKDAVLMRQKIAQYVFERVFVQSGLFTAMKNEALRDSNFYTHSTKAKNELFETKDNFVAVLQDSLWDETEKDEMDRLYHLYKKFAHARDLTELENNLDTLWQVIQEGSNTISAVRLLQLEIQLFTGFDSSGVFN